MDKELLQEAIEEFGKQIVYEVTSIVEMADADGTYTMFEDMGMFDHAECVSMLYFE